MRKTDKDVAMPSDKLDKAPLPSKSQGCKEAKSPPLTFDPNQPNKAEQPDKVLEKSVFRRPSPPPIG